MFQLTTVIKLARRHGLYHWVCMGKTWCGRPSSAITHEHRFRLRTSSEVSKAIAAGKWCRRCADGWWMAVGSREGSGSGYRRSPVPPRD